MRYSCGQLAGVCGNIAAAVFHSRSADFFIASSSVAAAKNITAEACGQTAPNPNSIQYCFCVCRLHHALCVLYHARCLKPSARLGQAVRQRNHLMQRVLQRAQPHSLLDVPHTRIPIDDYSHIIPRFPICCSLGHDAPRCLLDRDCYRRRRP